MWPLRLGEEKRIKIEEDRREKVIAGQKYNGPLLHRAVIEIK